MADTSANAVISANTAENLGLIKRIYEIDKTDTEALIEKYKDCFGEIGKLPVTHHITVNPDIKPVVNPPRNIPFGMKPKLKKELEKMTKMGIIKPSKEH